MSVPRSTIRLARSAPALVFALALSATACVGDGSAEESTSSTEHRLSPPVATFASTAARQWMTNLENSVKQDGLTPPVAARIYTYGAIAVYESVVHGMPGHRSLAGQLNGLDSLPTPNPSLEYDWPTVLAQTMHGVADGMYVYPLRVFFEYTTLSQAALQGLGPQQIGFRRVAGVPDTVIDNSIAYGNELAAALVTWMNSDGYPEARFKGYAPPTGPADWAPGGFADRDKVALPVEPYFGTLRPTVLTSPEECPLEPPAPFSTDPESEMYQQAYYVYDLERNLTDEQREIARYWADSPIETGTPPAHWVDIISSNIKSSNLADAAAAYAYVGLAMHDSFVAIWHAKYKYNVMRPETYIRRHIDPHWTPLLATPQFPEYVSGHSGSSLAVSVLMEEYFGTGPFTDETKVRRGFAPRTFDSYYDAAVEASKSRLYGGIHYPMASENGRALGKCIGETIRARVSLKY